MKSLHRILAIAIGVFAAAMVAERHSSPNPAQNGEMISECDGTIEEIVIHYVADDTIAMPIYQQFLPQLSKDVVVHIVCPDEVAFKQFMQRVGQVRCELSPIIVDHPITVWSRDRWIALQSNTVISLLSPRDEEGAEAWPARAGDARVASDIAQQLKPDVTARKMDISFDGGDLLANDKTVFVTPAVFTKNIGRTVETRQELLDLLARNLHRKIVPLDAAPDHHAGMYMMAADDHTILVGDPSLAKSFCESPDLPGGADFSPATQKLFDAVATQISAQGYRVVRIPTIPANDGKTYLTYVNVLTDHRDSKKIVYMPVYQGVDALNSAAANVWRSLGYQVRTIDCTSCYRNFGTLHCLVNILKRS